MGVATVEDFRDGLKLGDSIYIKTGTGPVLARFIEWRGREWANVRKFIAKKKAWKRSRTRVHRDNLIRVAPKPIKLAPLPDDKLPMGLCPYDRGTLVASGSGLVCLNCGRSPGEDAQILPVEEED